MKRRFFDLIGSTLTLEYTNDAATHQLLNLIAELEIETGPDHRPNYTIVVTDHTERLDLPDSETFFSGDVEDMGFFKFARNDTHWSLVQDREISGMFSLDRRGCQINMLPSSSAQAENLVMGFALDQAILIGNQSLIHAAVVEVPDGRSRIIIHAKSGTGKTTTTMALAAAGYRLCSDDVAVISANHGTDIHAWGLPRDVKIRRNTATMLPWLRKHLPDNKWNRLNAQVFKRTELKKIGYLADETLKPVSAVIALKRAEDAVTSIRQMDRFEGLVALSSENIQLNEIGLLPGHEVRFDLYANVIKDATPYELSASNNIQEIVDAINSITQS